MYHHALAGGFAGVLAGKFPHVWDPPQVLFSGHGTEATDTVLERGRKARQNCLPVVSCALWEEGELFDFLYFG